MQIYSGLAISVLSNAMVGFTDSKEVVIKHYEKAFEIYDGIDESVDGAILAHSLANEKMLHALDKQKKVVSKMTIDKPSGFTGFFESTVGAGLTTVGSRLSGVGEWLIDGFDELDRELQHAREDGMNPGEYWAKKVAMEVLIGAPLAVGAGVLELGGVGASIVGQPSQSLKGIGALFGRNPMTGEWWDGTGAQTWKEMGKAVTSWDYFKKGQFGVGIGKILPNVILTLTGAGAVAQGGKAAINSIKAARVAGKGASEALKVGVISGGRATGTALVDTGKNVAKAARGAVTNVKELGIKGVSKKVASKAAEFTRSMGDQFASKSKMVEKLLGKEAAARGLTLRQERLVSKLQDLGPDHREFIRRMEMKKAENPQFSQAQLRYDIAREDPRLFRRATEFESTHDELLRVSQGGRENRNNGKWEKLAEHEEKDAKRREAMEKVAEQDYVSSDD